MNPVEHFENLLAGGNDDAVLRFSLGNAYINEGENSKAIEHLAQALAYDPWYSAAWKAYGKALTATGQLDQARKAYERGIEAAEDKGDKQAVKEMQVFLKRLQKDADG